MNEPTQKDSSEQPPEHETTPKKRRRWSRVLTRPMRFVLDIALMIVFLSGIGVSTLMWRLDQGNISLERLMPVIRDGLQDLAPGMNFTIQRAEMTRGSNRWRAFEVHLSKVQVIDADQKEIGSLDQMVLGFSWRNFFHLSIIPSTIEIKKPTLQVTRFPDGHIGLMLISEDNGKEEHTDTPGLAHAMSRTLKALREVSVHDATIHYDDERDHISLDATDGVFYLKRERDKINGTLSLHVKGKKLDEKLVGTIDFDPKNEVTRFTLGAKDVPPEEVVEFIPQIPNDLKITMPISFALTAIVDKAYVPVSTDIQVTGGKGTLHYPPYYPEEVPISDLFLKASYHPMDGSFHAEDISVKLKKAPLRAQLNISSAEEGKPRTVELVGLLTEFPVDDLKHYWPHELAHDARTWIMEHLYDGLVDRAGIAMKGELDAENKFSVKEVGGKISFHGMTVDYLPPMLPVKNVKAEADYSLDHFGIAVESGEVLGTKVDKADILINGFDQDTQMIDLKIDTTGPIADAVTIISAKPLEYPQALGFNANQFSGNAVNKLHLRFPLLNDLQLDQVEMVTEADLSSVTMRNAVKDLNVTSEAMKIRVDTKGLELTGKGKLADAPADIRWQEFFDDKAPHSSIMDVSGDITPNVLKALHLPVGNYFGGSAAATVQVKEDQKKTNTISVTADLQKSSVTVPELRLKKDPGSAGRLELQVTALDKGTTTLSKLNGSWPGFAVKDGMVRWSAADKLESANLKGMTLGRSKADVVITPIAQGLKAVVHGDTIDLSNYWTAPKDPNAKKDIDPRRYDVDMIARTLYLDKEIPLRNMNATVSVQKGVLLRGNITAVTDQSGSLRLQQVDQKDGSRRLGIRIQNAGRVFQALDMTDKVNGGTFTLQGVSTRAAPNVISGNADLTDFTIAKAPVLARLLNAFSLGGILELLNGRGLAFSKMSSKVILEDPQTIRLVDGRMAGASLGMTFKGRIYRDSQTVNLSGTIVPVSGINKMVGKIPLVGQILGGLKGEGLLAATYKIKGPTSDPQVSVNPLSVLAPGILRSIFFQGKDD